MQQLLYKPAYSWLGYVDAQLLWKLIKNTSFVSIRRHVSRYFKNTRPRQLIEFPVLFLKAEEKYRVGIQQLFYKPAYSWLEYVDAQLLWKLIKNTSFVSIRRHVSRYFKNTRPRQLIGFPVLFLKAEEKYRVGMQQLFYKPAYSWLECVDAQLLWKLIKNTSFVSIRRHVSRYFKNTRLRQLIGFPVLFLGAAPRQTPALYSLMNYADIALGTWYPVGGMYQLVRAMTELAKEKGVQINYTCEAEHTSVTEGRAQSLRSSQGEISTDVLVSAADYQHTECLLPKQWRTYGPRYWKERKMAASALIYYIGVSKRLSGLLHHNLFFDTSFDTHLASIYKGPTWPAAPLFYACVPSRTDVSCAPSGCENIFLLIPVSASLTDNEQLREDYYELLLCRLEKHTGESIRPYVTYKRSYAASDFIADYHAYRGNAYGLANTLRQPAVGKPSMRSRRVRNLFFCGQLTTPGPGVPPSIISGQVAAQQAQKHYPK